jgi:hypothetical protein
MADIVNAQVELFANERVRTLANRLTQAYYALLAYQNDCAAQGIVARINAAGASGAIADGAAASGLPILSGTQVINLNAGLSQLRTAWDTTAVAGVGTSVKAIMDAFQHNGSPA